MRLENRKTGLAGSQEGFGFLRPAKGQRLNSDLGSRRSFARTPALGGAKGEVLPRPGYVNLTLSLRRPEMGFRRIFLLAGTRLLRAIRKALRRRIRRRGRAVPRSITGLDLYLARKERQNDK